jgi:gluconate 2-dehydrogenase gamma chain
MVDRIIPEDDYPGAWDAGVGTFIERLITEEEGLEQPYMLGLVSVNEEALAFFGMPFTALSAADQDAILKRIEMDTLLTEWTFDAQQFFRTVINHTMEGYYADPGNGGNLNGIAWKMVGFEVTA